jgi:hypothetical protein
MKMNDSSLQGMWGDVVAELDGFEQGTPGGLTPEGVPE